jgi:DNA polymerase elongation subunit (family B)
VKFKAVSAGYGGGNRIWIMGADGTVSEVTIGKEIPYPYFYSDAELKGGFGVVSCKKEKIRILKANAIEEKEMWKIEMMSPHLTKMLRAKAKESAEDDIVYLDRRLGADGEIEWVLPDRISYMDIESDRKTGKLALIGSVLEGKYESFTEPKDYFQYLEAHKVAAVTAWNGDKYDFRILNNLSGGFNEYWNHVRKIDSMSLYAAFSPRHARRGLDVVARREKVGKKLDPDEVGLIPYNENDCRVMEAIIKKLDLIGTEYALGSLTGIMPAPDNLRAIAMWENYLMKNRSKFGLWLEGGHGFKKKEGSYQGGLVLYGEPGIYDGAAMFDYTSLYPNVVINNQYKGEGEEVWRVMQKSEAEFVALKAASTGALREAYKKLANSSYGIFGNGGFRYSNRLIAAFITSNARDQLMELRKIAEDLGFVPIVSDTDSCSIQIPKDKAEAVLKIVNKRLAPYPVKLEYYASRFLIFGGTGKKAGEATKKRYAVMTEDGELIVKGLEMIRNDWSPHARDCQETLLRAMLTGPQDEVGKRLSDAVVAERQAFFGGKIPLDDLAITKSIDTERDYKVKVQHLKAYEQLTDKGQGVIGFVTYWVGPKGQTIVRNGRTDEEILKLLDLNVIWKKQIEPMVQRLETCLPQKQPKISLDVYLEETK